MNTHPGIENGITAYLHCKRCLDEQKRPDIAVGITVNGDLQVWCETHDINVGLLEMPKEQE